MKKISPFLLCLIIATMAQAQTFIPKAGITLSKVEAEITAGMKSKIGLTMGVAYNHEINELMSVQPELNFVQKGYRTKYSQNDNGSSIDSKVWFTVNYLEIPVLFKVSQGSANLKYYFNAGPSLGIGLGGKFKMEYTVEFLGFRDSGSEEGKIKFGDRDDTEEGVGYLDNRIDFGIQAGGGVLIADKIMIDLRYGHSLTSMTDETDEMSKTKNRVFQFTVGYAIRMK